MNYSYGTDSLRKLSTIHPYLQILMHELIRFMDIKILQGIRTREEHEELMNVDPPVTSIPYSKTKHRGVPLGPGGKKVSMAVDAAPYPVIWEGPLAFARFAWMQGHAMMIWEKLKAEGRVEGRLRSGIDWDNDGDITDHKLKDGPHMELILDD